MKAAHMGIPVLISQSGITYMGLELAQDLGVTMIARAKGKHFLVYNGEDTVLYDQKPKQKCPSTTPVRPELFRPVPPGTTRPN